jgi:dihydropteroate synthase
MEPSEDIFAGCEPLVMGIVNVTPDSFSDGGLHLTPHDALARAEGMLAEGAAILDVGAESSRPGSDRIDAAEQIARLAEILPPLCRMAQRAGRAVSIDTTRAEVARFALDAGAIIVNDISAGRDEPALLALAAQYNARVVLMHMQGQPATMQADPHYDDVVTEVRDFLAGRLAAAEAAGLDRSRCIVDPGIGFGKTTEHNLALLAGLGRLRELGCDVLLGPSRKRFIDVIATAPDPTERLGGTIAACLAGLARGARIFRVHDVGPVAQALRIARAIEPALNQPPTNY